MRSLTVWTAAAALVASAALSQAEWVAPGPKVGATFGHDLRLSDHAGTERSLATLYGQQGSIVFFVRSADWCPFCKRQLVDVNARLDEFLRRGYSVISVSVDTPAEIAAFRAVAGIRYTMLADPTGAVAAALDIRDEQYPVGSNAFGVPHPMIFVLDRDGTVVAKFAERGYRSRPNLDLVIAHLDGLAGHQHRQR